MAQLCLRSFASNLRSTTYKNIEESCKHLVVGLAYHRLMMYFVYCEKHERQQRRRCCSQHRVMENQPAICRQQTTLSNYQQRQQHITVTLILDKTTANINNVHDIHARTLGVPFIPANNVMHGMQHDAMDTSFHEHLNLADNAVQVVQRARVITVAMMPCIHCIVFSIT